MALPQSNYFKRTARIIAVIDILILLILIGTLIYLYFIWPSFVHQQIKKIVVIKNGTEAMDRFTSTKETKMYMKFWLFNVTNPNEVENNGSKANLVDVGPFVFSELKDKIFLQNDQEAGFITYKLNRQWFFEPALSKFDLKTPITMLNVPLLVTTYLLDEMRLSQFVYPVINGIVRLHPEEKGFITDTAINFLFDGSYRQIMDTIRLLPGTPKPWPMKDDKFGFYFDRNNTYDEKLDGILTQSTGEGSATSLEQVGQLVARNYNDKLNFWQNDTSTCNALNVSMGEIYPPFSLLSAPQLTLFSNDLCRKLTLKRVGRLVHKGINSVKYEADESNFLSIAKNKANGCYCLSKTAQDQYWCLQDGLLDMQTCQQSGIYASNPFFYMGSPNLSDHVTNLRKPDSEKDSTFVILEPKTGSAISFQARFQLNARVRPNKLNIFKFIKEEYMFPLMHMEESADISDSIAKDVSNKLEFFNYWIIAVILLVFALIMMILLSSCSILFVYICKCRDDDKAGERAPLLTNIQDDEPQEQIAERLD